MKKINLLAAAVLAAGALSSSAFADYTPNAYFGGYFRSGVMHSQSGRSAAWNKNQVGRLGNENDTYGEIVLGADVAKVDNTVWTVNTRMAVSNNHNVDWQLAGDSNNGSGTDYAFREFWLNVKGICSWDADANLWAGKRYYRREDIHTIDVYYFDISGMGAGIENLSVGPGKFHAAWLRQDDSTDYKWKDDYVSVVKASDGKALGKPSAVSLDKIDLEYDLPVWDGGNLEFRTAFFIPTRDSNDSYKKYTTAEKEFKGAQLYTVELSQGYSLGWNKTVVQYFHGSNADWSAWGTGNWLNYDGSSNKAHRWSIYNFGETHFTDSVGMFHVAYATASDGYDNNVYSANYTAKKSDKAFQLVVRPYVKLTKMSRLYAELGWFAKYTKNYNKKEDGDYIYHTGTKHEGEHGSKYTIAYALTPDAGNFWSRPELRFFVSYLRGCQGADISSNGGTSDYQVKYKDTNYVLSEGNSKKSNYVFGVQAEAWW